LSSCSKNNDIDFEEITLHNNPFPATFVKEKEIKVEAITKGYPHFARINDNDHVFIKFRNGDGDHEIWKYNTSLECQKKFIIKYGQGPSEAMKPLILGGTPNEIVMYDISYRRILYWDSNFDNCVMKKRSLINHGFAYNGFGYSPEYDCALIWEEIDSPSSNKTRVNVYLKSIKKEKTTDRKLYEFEYLYFNRDVNGGWNFWPSRPFHCILLKDFVFLINLKEYVINKYDLMGRLLKRVKVSFQKKKFSSRQLKEWEKGFGVKKAHMNFPGELWPACWLLPIDKGFVVGRREDYKPSNKYCIPADYYDISLRYLGQINLPSFDKRWKDPFYGQTYADIRALGKGRRLYIITEDEGGNGDYILSRWILKHEER
jgi:hypothetical protein